MTSIYNPIKELKPVLIIFLLTCSIAVSGQDISGIMHNYITLDRQGKTKERALKHVREITLSVTDKCYNENGTFEYHYDEHGNITKEITLHYTKEYTNIYHGPDLSAVYIVEKSNSYKDRKDTATYFYKDSLLQRINEPTSHFLQHKITDFTYDNGGRLMEERTYFQARYSTGLLEPINITRHFYTKDSTYTLSKSLRNDTSSAFIHLKLMNKNGKVKVEKYGIRKNQKTVYTTVNTYTYNTRGNLTKTYSIGYHSETGTHMLGPYTSLYKNNYDKSGKLVSIEEFHRIREDGVSTHALYIFDKQGKITSITKECTTWVYTYK
jgi:hypothetical protein